MRVRLSCLAVCLLMGGIADARSDEIQDYYDLLRGYFRNSHWIPVIIPRNEKIGNVYNIRTLQFIADASNCFPKLVYPKPEPTVLLNRATGKSTNGALAIGSKEIAKASAQLGIADSMTFELAEPHVVSLPALTLANLFDAGQCSFYKNRLMPPKNRRRQQTTHRTW